jgi:putative transposase
MIEPGHPRLSLRRQCALLGLSRGACSYTPAPASGEDLTLMRLLDEEYMRHPFYGVRRMRLFLEGQGWAIGHDRVRRLLRTMGLMAIYPKPRLSAPGAGHTIYPYLLRGMKIEAPDHVWSTDITYVPMARGFVYLTAVMDWFSRYVLAWQLSLTLDAGFCLEALEAALARSRPRIFNTDQGRQFTSEAFTGRLRAAGVAISMDGRGRALDNVFVERLWRSVKYEEIYLKSYRTVWEARAGIGAWFDFYNRQRPHMALAGRTPADVYGAASPPLPSPPRGGGASLQDSAARGLKMLAKRGRRAHSTAVREPASYPDQDSNPAGGASTRR